MINHCVTALLLLLAGASCCSAGLHSNLQNLRLFLPDEDDVLAPQDLKRSRRDADPESFSDFFKKLQLAQSELKKNASVGEAAVEEVFKQHGLVSDETTITPPTTDANSSNASEQLCQVLPTVVSKSVNGSKLNSSAPGNTTVAPRMNCSMSSTTEASKTNLTTTALPSTNATEFSTTTLPSTTTRYTSDSWWGVSKKKHGYHQKALKAALVGEVVGRVKSGLRDRKRRS